MKKKYYREQVLQPENGWRRDLRGMSHTQMTNLKGFKGGTRLGPANSGRRLSRSEREKVEADMRERGLL